jgi:hypothetical protein
MCAFNVEYEAVLRLRPELPHEDLTSYLVSMLPDLWCAQYREMTGGVSNILEFEDRGFTFLFDFTSELDEPDLAEDRVVAAYGLTFAPSQERDASRMRGYPLSVNPEEIDGEYDRGHFISHLGGGSLDVNLFPQKREVNRGWSEEGELFRRMERKAAGNPGTFCFARPIYHDPSYCPAILEYGVLRQDGTLWVERFSNV